jgi:DNA-binding transcriptional LysR family regulator
VWFRRGRRVIVAPRFCHLNGRRGTTPPLIPLSQFPDPAQLTFQPYFSMNDYAGLATALLAGVGIGDLPPVVEPDLLRDGRLVEIMPRWKFRNFDLSLVHAGNRHVPQVVRVFKEFAAKLPHNFSQRYHLSLSGSFELFHFRKIHFHLSGWLKQRGKAYISCRARHQ